MEIFFNKTGTIKAIKDAVNRKARTSIGLANLKAVLPNRNDKPVIMVCNAQTGIHDLNRAFSYKPLMIICFSIISILDFS